MRILHYTLGLPPYRSGGLTKYATDLMQTQSKGSDNISLLYPGDFRFWTLTKTRIYENKVFENIQVFELINPSPVPLLHGTKQPKDIYNYPYKLTLKQLESFYAKVLPDIFHVHTLMGLPIELVRFFKTKGVKIVFTTHDYYGLCPKVNFINTQGKLCSEPGGKNCSLCNMDSPGSLFLKLRNSKYLLKFKSLIKSNNIIQATENKSAHRTTNKVVKHENEQEFELLLNHYKEIINLFDHIHYNSNITKSTYEKYIQLKNSTTLPISHAGIKNNWKKLNVNPNNIRMGFIGNLDNYKGFPSLKQELIKLNKEGINNWTLNVWGGAISTDTECSQIQYRGVFADIQTAFHDMDFLVVPSIWKETFSLITIEALSFGVPVLVSENVGAKDIVKVYQPDFIYTLQNKGLYVKLKQILTDTNLLINYNKQIQQKGFNHCISEHQTEIQNLYKSILQEA